MALLAFVQHMGSTHWPGGIYCTFFVAMKNAIVIALVKVFKYMCAVYVSHIFLNGKKNPVYYWSRPPLGIMVAVDISIITTFHLINDGVVYVPMQSL